MSKQKSPALSLARLRIRGGVLNHWTMSTALGLALVACGGEDLPGTDDFGSGGATASGGALQASGGATSPSGGSSASGGATASGGAASSGGATASGGTDSVEGSGGGIGEGSGGETADGSGGGGSDECVKGTTKGNEVLFIGESFVQASTIPEETTNLARAAGSLAANDSYVDKSVSGTWIGNGAGNSIPNQYKNNSNGVRFVLMNGGGNDCWQGGAPQDQTNALNAAEKLFDDMDANGVEKIVYFFYPDPIGGGFADLTTCLNELRPKMKALCDAQGSPKCYWLDLRDTWNGHPEYTMDGIHVAGPGNVPTATAIWETMEENCVAP